MKAPLPVIRLIHWKAEEAVACVSLLQSPGYQVEYEPFRGMETMKQFRAHPPALFLIDLSRLPSQGRDLGMMIRQYADTRTVPILYAGGAADKVEAIRAKLPDAVYAEWKDIDTAIHACLESPPEVIVKPKSSFEGYSGAPLEQKLGLKSGQTVLLLHPPDGFREYFSHLPKPPRWVDRYEKPVDLILWFCRNKATFLAEFDQIRPWVGKDGIWVCWIKKSADPKSDMNQVIARERGLANGLVDYKVCSVDETWSGLKFALREKKQA